jgi:hypothetical protein
VSVFRISVFTKKVRRYGSGLPFPRSEITMLEQIKKIIHILIDTHAKL